MNQSTDQPAADEGADYRVSPAQLGELLSTSYGAAVPVMIWGPPGTAKSATCRQFADSIGAEFRDIRALLLEPVDLRGIPWVDKGITRWAPPEFLPPQDSTEKWVLCLEELPAATRDVQAAMYQLVQDRKCGEYVLPEGAYVIATGNGENDGSVSRSMPQALRNRFLHANMRTDVDGWLEWAAKNDLAPEVRFFIRFRPEMLYVFDPKSKSMAYPTLRTWEYASDVLKNETFASPDTKLAAFVGTIGEQAAVEFMAFLDVWGKIPMPQDILDHPETAEAPDDVSALLALCGALSRLANDKTFEAIVTFATRIPRKEVGEFLVGQCIAADKSLVETAAYVTWTAKQTGGIA